MHHCKTNKALLHLLDSPQKVKNMVSTIILTKIFSLLNTVKPRLSGTSMGLAHCVILSEVSNLVKRAIITGYWEHSSQVQFKILFANHAPIKYINMINELMWGRYRFVEIWHYWKLLEICGGKIHYFICYLS